MSGWWNQLKASWYRSFSLLWIFIIALQWLSYTDPVWLQQTSDSVLLTLTVIAVIEILLPVPLLYRMLVEGCAILYIVFRTINHYGLYIPYPSAPAGERLDDLLNQMTPYLWFALSAWALMLLVSYAVTSKARILLFIGTNITALAALDSFTSEVLWQEVAWTVLAGLGWLVTRHLNSFQRHYPRSWRAMLNYPLKIVVNIVLVIALVIIAGVNVPSVRPTLTDPYTAWREWNGTGTTQNRSAAKAQTDSSGTGSKGTASGYSLDDSNLGGGFAFDYSPVMSITTDTRIYMRGETRSVYSGKGWSDNIQSRRGGLDSAEVGEELENDYASKVPTKELKYSVRMLSNNRYPVLFGAYSISRIESIEGGSEAEGISWRSRDVEALVGKDLVIQGKSGTYPKSYELTSQLPVVPVQELSAKTFFQLYDGKDVPETYLQLPGSFPDRVRNLAAEVTAGANTPYEKILLLQQYLRETFPYTNQPDLSRKKSKDFVESFLFEIKEGYCDYYSTALVTMARSLDIPARWVKGYAPGEQAQLPDNVAMQVGRTTNSNYTITNADAHSWAEVYFGDYGWLPIEATPGFSAPMETENTADDQPQPSESPEQSAVNEEQTDPAGDATDTGMFSPWIVAAAAAVIAGWGSYLLWSRRVSLRFLLQRLRYGRPLSPAERIVAETERWVAMMRRKGCGREGNETLRESVNRWSGERPAAAGSLAALLDGFEKAKYSPEIIEDKDWQAVYTETLRLRTILRRK
ncbi:transglutaminase [Paenibacillus stellifer]|uniref:Transglutaminase n=1 Tax=Paenibacillus stellifer TaxID=169760 RepID=A0A089LSL3_9BACL|nr:transglutaminase-like domain-containing protein [Paenibacillus stellifer]AIQ63090.1 transglutaminase [Paenibacillus stellifer]